MGVKIVIVVKESPQVLSAKFRHSIVCGEVEKFIKFA
jgi:hypothetical protein